MSWLRYTFILKIIGGYLMSDLSRNLVHLRWLLKLVNFRAVKRQSEVAYHYYNHRYGFTFHFYILE
ncbi:hypothetical protein Gotur_005849 [Gossypium turneri]